LEVDENIVSGLIKKITKLQNKLNEKDKKNEDLSLKNKEIENLNLEIQLNQIINNMIKNIEEAYDDSGVPKIIILIYKIIKKFRDYFEYEKIILKIINEINKQVLNKNNILFWLNTLNHMNVLLETEFNQLNQEKIKGLIFEIFQIEVKRIYSLLDFYIEKNMLSESIHPITVIFNNFYKELLNHSIDREMITNFYQQILYYINSITFNLLLKNQKYCSINYSILLKISISKIENWCWEKKINKDIIDYLIETRQCCDLLIMNKSTTYLIENIYNKLNNSQILKILKNYQKDE
jgi:hypothetical protein